MSRTCGERTERAGPGPGPVVVRSSSEVGQGENTVVPCRDLGTGNTATGTRLGRRSGRGFLPYCMQAEPRGLRGRRGLRPAWLVTQPADDRYSSCRLGRYCFAGAITGRLVVRVAGAADTELVVRCHSGDVQPCSEAQVGLGFRPYRRRAMRFDQSRLPARQNWAEVSVSSRSSCRLAGWLFATGSSTGGFCICHSQSIRCWAAPGTARWHGEGNGQMCCDAREPLAGCTQSEAESNQSLRMMLLRAAAGSATKFGREHSDRVPRSQHWNLEELGSPGDPCPSGPSLVGPGAPLSLLHPLVLWTST